jgi:hypothetical protein
MIDVSVTLGKTCNARIATEQRSGRGRVVMKGRHDERPGPA